jgi:hypothetical protein
MSYMFTSSFPPGTLEDFWADVEKMLKEEGVS